MANVFDQFDQAPTRPANGPGGIKNNPGNLRPAGKSTGFQEFGSPEEGLTAIENQLRIYGEKHGVKTLRGVISRWSPSTENDTDRLIVQASKRLGLDPDKQIDLKDPVVRRVLSAAIVQQEGPVFRDGGKDSSPTPTTPNAGGGRGFVNPPTVDQPQPEMPRLAETPITGRRGGTTRELRGAYGPGQMAPGNSGGRTAEAAETALISGVTSGTDVYARAGLRSLAGKKDFKTNLSDVRGEQTALAQEYPNLTTAGKVAGNIGLAALTGGTSLPGQIAANAGIAGVQKWTESGDTTLGDASASAGLGALFTVGGAGIVKAVDRTLRTIGKQATVSNLWRLGENTTERSTFELEKLFGKTAEEIKAATGLSIHDYAKAAAKEIDALPATAIKPQGAAGLAPGSAGMAAQTLKSDISNLAGNAVGTAIGGVGGGVGGLAWNAALPEEFQVNPLYAAGAGTVAGAASRYGGTKYMFSPKTQMFADRLQRSLGPVSGAAANRVTETSVTANPFDKFGYEE